MICQAVPADFPPFVWHRQSMTVVKKMSYWIKTMDIIIMVAFQWIVRIYFVLTAKDKAV